MGVETFSMETLSKAERPPQPFVAFSGVRKTYDGRTLIVRDLNLSIAKGEFLTLLGPSGSGKTTCLMMLAGFETPTEGSISLDGVLLNQLPPHKRNIGMVFQNYALFPHMTVGENLAFPLSVRRLPKAEITAKVARALDMVKLDGFADRLPAQLSGGQQQRVALARALVFEPTLVLMDEPLGALDKQLREHMQIEIKHLHERLGITVVYVTHDQSEALTMSDRIAVFSHGMIQQIDPPSVIYDAPRNSFVANFIGENNSLPGVVTALADGYCQVSLAGDQHIRARAVHPSQPGERTMVSLRPEKVVLHPDTRHSNQLTGRFEELIYFGDHARLRLSLPEGLEFTVKLPSGAVAGGLVSGDPITVGFAADDCRALDVA